MFRFSKFFKRTEKFFEDMGKQMNDMSEAMEKDFEEVHDQLDFEMGTLDKMAAGEEKETVREERKPDGTVIITRTILRKTSK